MRLPAALTTDSIAVCGMPCFCCWKYCANSKPCPGCRADGKNKPRGCRDCAVKDCAAGRGLTFCFDCLSYPCRLIKNLERNYKRYDFSFITYGRFAREHGAAALLAQYRRRFACPHCGGVLSLHDRVCTACDRPDERKETAMTAPPWHDLYPTERQPTAADIAAFVGTPLWTQFCGALEQAHNISPTIQYSGCAMAPGWNVKYKKRGKALCTLYPDAGRFSCLLMIPDAKQNEAALLLETAAPVLREQYCSLKSSMGGRWPMVDMTDEQLVQDVLALIALKLA